MVKKFYQVRESAEKTYTAQFQITTQGLESVKRLGIGVLAVFSYQKAALKMMARGPQETWTALELAYEDGQPVHSDDFLKALKQLESKGLVARMN